MPKNNGLHGEQDIRGTSWDGLNVLADALGKILPGEDGTIADGLFAIARGLNHIAVSIDGLATALEETKKTKKAVRA